MNELSKDAVSWLTVGDDAEGQRIDNFLVRTLKGVPKSHIYRILRSGEVRVNKGRVGPDVRLAVGDVVRLPPVRTAAPARPAKPAVARRFGPAILYEDDALIAVDKPAGLAVHGGSGIALGMIEQLRAARPDARFLELVHRLDRDTSGILLFAKRRSALTAVQERIRSGKVTKRYLALLAGRMPKDKMVVDVALQKSVLQGGERMVRVDEEGKPSRSVFVAKQRFGDATYVEV
jgi:23S rRNA pseudouridine955/2504/2580 synthase